MKTQTYRLLNQGEALRKGDEYLHDDQKQDWQFSSGEGIVGKLGYALIYRRPIENQWIALCDRKPTKKDGERVLVRYEGAETMNALKTDYVENGLFAATHWCRIPEFHEEDPFEEWLKTNGSKVDFVETSRHVFNAGRDYEKGKK